MEKSNSILLWFPNRFSFDFYCSVLLAIKKQYSDLADGVDHSFGWVTVSEGVF